jgi:hypothetical protein
VICYINTVYCSAISMRLTCICRKSYDLRHVGHGQYRKTKILYSNGSPYFLLIHLQVCSSWVLEGRHIQLLNAANLLRCKKFTGSSSGGPHIRGRGLHYSQEIQVALSANTLSYCSYSEGNTLDISVALYAYSNP